MLFTVIIPAYNCELYLRDCVDSVLSQSFIDFEVVLVNDGSTDGTSTLCDEIAVDPRVTVLHQANGGASLARNVGMEHARGDYVVFLDADDELSTDYLGDLANELQAGPVDVILGSVRTDFGNGVDDTNVLLFDSAYTGQLDLAGLVNYFFTTADDAPFAAWHNVYSRDFLSRHRLTFDEEMILSEDRDFVLRVLAQRPVWRCVCVPGYRHRVNVADSVTAQVGIRKILRAMAGDEKWIRISYENELFAPAAPFFAGDYIGLILMSLQLPSDKRRVALERASDNKPCFTPAFGGGFFFRILHLHVPVGCLLVAGKVVSKLTSIRRKHN